MEFKVESLDGNLSTFTMNYTNIGLEYFFLVCVEKYKFLNIIYK